MKAVAQTGRVSREIVNDLPSLKGLEIRVPHKYVKVGIVGSRRRHDRKTCRDIEDVLADIASRHQSRVILISGGCPKGGDYFAEQLAVQLGLPIIIFKAQWEEFGKVAGFKRNTDIAYHSDILIAAPAEDRTGGTEDTIRKFVRFDKHSELILV